MEERICNIYEVIEYIKGEPEWKFEWMKALTLLCLEYLTLDGLQDAKRASEIPSEIECLVASIDKGGKPCGISCSECEFKPNAKKIIGR